MKKYFEQIFNKYAKEDSHEKFVDIKFFGNEFKIKEKNRKNFRNILMKNIRQQDKEINENKIMKSKLNLVLEKFNKNKTSIKNRNIYSSSILFRKNKKNSKKNINDITNKESNKEPKNLIKSKKEENKIEKEEDEEEYKNKYFIGIKMDSIDELEQKKEEILENMKDDIIKGEIGHSEMDYFLSFQKRMNAYRIDPKQSKHFVKLLEQEFISFEEELKIKEQRKKEEKRINNFFNNLNYDIEKNYYFKKAQKQFFCNVMDFNEKYNINILSPTKDISINSN